MRADLQFNPTEQVVERELRRYYAAGEPAAAFVAQLGQRLAAQARAAEPARQPAPRVWDRWLAAPRAVRWASVAAALLVVLTLTVAALGPQRVWAGVQRLLGYVPGIGFVNLAETRVLVAPVEMTRTGITLRVEQAIAAPDRTRVVIRSEGLPPEDALLPAGAAAPVSAPDTFTLRLPDGRALLATKYSLRWGAGTLTFPALPADVFTATLELARLPLLPAGAAPEGWRVGLALQPATGPLVAVLYPQPYQPAGARDTHHGITVSVLDVAHSPEATVVKLRGEWEDREWEIRGLVGGRRLPALRDDAGGGAGHVYGWAPAPASGSTVVREVVSVPLPPDGATPAPRSLVIEQEVALAPLSALAHDLTLELADVEVEAPAAGSFRITIPPGARIGDAWPLDVRLDVAGFPVHITGARLYEETLPGPGGDLNRTVLEFDVATVPAQGDASLAIFRIDSSSPAWSSGPGALNLGEGRMSVSLALEQGAPLAGGEIDVEVAGASLILHGPWRMHWQIPGRAADTGAPVPLHPADATDRHGGLTLQLVEAVHTDRLTQLRIDLKDPPAGVQLGGLQLWDAAAQRNGLVFEDDRGRQYDPVSPNTRWRQKDEATFGADSPSAGRQTFVLPPVDPLARRFTVTFPAIEVIHLLSGSFVVTVPAEVVLADHPQASGMRVSAPWPVDVAVQVGDETVRYTQATLMERRAELWVLLGGADAPVSGEKAVAGLCGVSIMGPNGEAAASAAGSFILGAGPCVPAPGFAVQDAAGRLAPGEYRVSFDGVAVRVPGPWRLSWDLGGQP